MELEIRDEELRNVWSILDEPHTRAEEPACLTALEQTAELIVITDQEGTIRYVNAAFESETGYSKELLKGKHRRILEGDTGAMPVNEEMWETAKRGQTWTGAMTCRGKGDTACQREATLSPLRDSSGLVRHYMLILRNVTAESALQEHRLHAQKMEVMGTLAGGIAHDFNSILAAILGNAELALDDLPEGASARHNMQQILKAVLRGRDLVRPILAFTRKSDGEQIVLTLGPLVKETYGLLRASLSTAITMKLNLQAEADAVYADPSQIQQVIMNLCTNAAHAMRQQGGRLEVSLRNITLQPDEPLPDPDMTPGDHVLLSVRDTGCGMDESVQKRIFQPYFTTKPAGEAAGLGLSIVRKVVKRHKGGIIVLSEPGKGSVFRVFFPKAAEMDASQKATSVPTSRGNERVLFVDDDELMADVGRDMLEHLGYDTVMEMDPVKALRHFAEHPGKFDLVITDQTMQRMTGITLAEKLLQIRHDIPIIVYTGYSDLVSRESIRSTGIRRFLAKPLAKQEMAEAIRQVLDGQGRT